MKAPAHQAFAPISACLVSGAVHGAPGSLRRLADRAVYVERDHAYTWWPCLHVPRCAPVTAAQLCALASAIPDLTGLVEDRLAKESEVVA